MSETILRPFVFPEGTSVGIYRVETQPELVIGKAPIGTAEQTAVVAADGTLTFSNVTPDVEYFAVGQVNGVWRNIRFVSPTVATVPTSGVTALLDLDDVDPSGVAPGKAPVYDGLRFAMVDIATQAELVATSGVTPGSYGTSSLVPRITVDDRGRVTAVTEQSIAGGGGGTGLPSVADFFANGVKGLGSATTGNLASGSNHLTSVAATGDYAVGDWITVVGAGSLDSQGNARDLLGVITAKTSSTLDIQDGAGNPVNAGVSVTGAAVMHNALPAFQAAVNALPFVTVPDVAGGYGWHINEGQDGLIIPVTCKAIWTPRSVVLNRTGSYPLNIGGVRFIHNEGDVAAMGNHGFTSLFLDITVDMKGPIDVGTTPTALGKLNVPAVRLATPSGGEGNKHLHGRVAVKNGAGQSFVGQNIQDSDFDVDVDGSQRDGCALYYTSKNVVVRIKTRNCNDDCAAVNSSSDTLVLSHEQPSDITMYVDVESVQLDPVITNQAVAIRGGEKIEVYGKARGGRFANFLVEQSGAAGGVYYPKDVTIHGDGYASNGYGFALACDQADGITFRGKIRDAKKSAAIVDATASGKVLKNVTLDFEAIDCGKGLDTNSADTLQHDGITIACAAGAEIDGLSIPWAKFVRPRNAAISCVAGTNLKRLRLGKIEVEDANWIGLDTTLDAILLQGLADFEWEEIILTEVDTTHGTARCRRGVFVNGSISAVSEGRPGRVIGDSADFNDPQSTSAGRHFSPVLYYNPSTILNTGGGTVVDSGAHIIDSKPAKARGNAQAKHGSTIAHGLCRPVTVCLVTPGVDQRVASAAPSGSANILITLRRSDTDATITVNELVNWAAEVQA